MLMKQLEGKVIKFLRYGMRGGLFMGWEQQGRHSGGKAGLGTHGSNGVIIVFANFELAE